MKIKVETTEGEQTYLLTAFPQDFPDTTLLKLEGYAEVLIKERSYQLFQSRLNTMDEYDLMLSFAKEIVANNYKIKAYK